jgi:hypothetical protein
MGLYCKRCATLSKGIPLHSCTDVRHDFCFGFRGYEGKFLSLTESVTSLRKLCYDQDQVLDLGRDESARVEFATVPRRYHLCPDPNASA